MRSLIKDAVGEFAKVVLVVAFAWAFGLSWAATGEWPPPNFQKHCENTNFFSYEVHQHVTNIFCLLPKISNGCSPEA